MVIPSCISVGDVVNLIAEHDCSDKYSYMLVKELGKFLPCQKILMKVTIKIWYQILQPLYVASSSHVMGLKSLLYLNVAFRPACRSSLCRFDGDIYTSVQAPLDAWG